MKQIGWRPYWSIDDYRAWPERKIGGDLPVEQGAITWRWNNWLTSLSVIRNAGIVLEVLYKDENDNDTFDRATDELIALHPMIMIQNEQLGFNASLAWAEHIISRLLIEPRVIEIASETLGRRYLQGRQLLYKPISKQLEKLLENPRLLANSYNQLATVYHNDIFDAGVDLVQDSKTWCGFKKMIDFSEIEKLAQQEASDVVSQVVALAKMDMYLASEIAIERTRCLKACLKRMSRTEISPDVNVT